jgi:hypothetical protein
MEVQDDPVIDRIQQRAKAQGLGLRTILEECLLSEVFRSR